MTVLRYIDSIFPANILFLVVFTVFYFCYHTAGPQRHVMLCNGEKFPLSKRVALIVSSNGLRSFQSINKNSQSCVEHNGGKSLAVLVQFYGKSVITVFSDAILTGGQIRLKLQ